MKTDNVEEKMLSCSQHEAIEAIIGKYPYLMIDWNRLMILVDHIQGMDDSFSVSMGYGLMSNLGISSHYAYCHVENYKGEEVIGHSGQKTLFESVFKTVMEFIKWYNQQPK